MYGTEAGEASALDLEIYGELKVVRTLSVLPVGASEPRNALCLTMVGRPCTQLRSKIWSQKRI